LKIAILGTRGVPNNHGGFEQFAESLSQFLVRKGHEVTVYNSHKHPYQEKTWKGVYIVHKYDPEYLIGTAGQFLYDFGCVMHTRTHAFDIILQLGYTSSSIWNRLFSKKSIIITNMDGLEWKRTKYNGLTQKFLIYAESLAVKHSNYLVADSIGIKKYLFEKYKVSSQYIAYGAEFFNSPTQQIIEDYNVTVGNYDLLIARLEPENNIETILDGVVRSKTKRDFLVIGKHETKYGEYLKEKYKNILNIKFKGGIYNQKHLDNLRYFSNLYFHGHSVGGTNPSLLEAMASGALIVANDNIFNKGVLEKDAFYFNDEEDIKKCLEINKEKHKHFIANNSIKIKTKFTTEIINLQYENFFLDCLKNSR
jgi:hypothetical protein